MNFINSPIGDGAEEEESTFLSDLVIGLLLVECCMFAGYFIANTLFG